MDNDYEEIEDLVISKDNYNVYENSKEKNEVKWIDNDDNEMPSNHVNNRKSASSAVSSFLDRPYLNRPPPSSPTLIDMSSTSQTLAEKDIQPSTLKFGFLGLGACRFAPRPSGRICGVGGGGTAGVCVGGVAGASVCRFGVGGGGFGGSDEGDGSFDG